jgi:hypothetical protein
MATFKVGQRVRIVANHALHEPKEIGDMPVGHEGVIVRAHPDVLAAWIVRIPDLFCHGDYGDMAPDEWGCYESELRPLTDPGCESFLQAMRDYANKQRTPVDVLRELHGEYLA